ncbi:MAG: NusG domain II-containing protein [Gemmatimonadota bacterium]|nr:NusG domain II-containing protein [Gemmatimonadota bacterium]
MERLFRLPPLFSMLDILLVIGLGTLAVSLYGYRWLGASGRGGQAGVLEVVVRAGEEATRYRLDNDTAFSVAGPLGQVEIEINGGEVWFHDSPCPLKICEKTGPISRPGEVIVCPPNRVLARIKGGGKPDSRKLDSVTR